METAWTPVLLVPCLVVLTAGLVYLHGVMVALLARSSVRNQVVVITDALSGLGRECAAVLHRGGARLVLCGNSCKHLEELGEDLTRTSDPTVTFPPKLVVLDFGDVDSLSAAVLEILDCYGCLDVVIFNSSLKVKGHAETLSLQLDQLLMDNNYFGPVTLAKGVLPSMMSRRRGHLVLVTSIQGKLAVPFRSAYAASKHAVQAFFDCLRAEVEEFGISVSTVSHTFISCSSLPSRKPRGVSPGRAAAEILKTLSSKKREVLLAPPLPKMAVYARSFCPNVLFSVTAAGARTSAASENM
ncbi:dehydrogenase/reductase SDR family member 7C-B-like isoform X1 [Kryptolebias marmoratus]|uniref:Dehydrogenase/reductase (SDR family) member 7Ca n=1 Tax=Kryptolebias marmoratus TaxID=37003 RepID=A0A3Q3F3E7_KRYMA|nr:dehydrogenase/reductase SDR family member 7C-B-like isoform X1 [Kryptolebias marmoratus]XP_037834724.1 dehydrogenase/reductase SDR family member 7C-B-like isoform X1 [Kryptolebias marmoratus]